MLSIAAGYEQLAQRAEERLRGWNKDAFRHNRLRRPTKIAGLSISGRHNYSFTCRCPSITIEGDLEQHAASMIIVPVESTSSKDN